MQEPKKISVPWGTGWLAPEKGQPKDGIWQGRIYGIEWEVKNGTSQIERAQIAFRKIRTVKILGRFAMIILKVDDIWILPWAGDNRLLVERVQERIISKALDVHGVHVESNFLEWVLEPAAARAAEFCSELDEQCRSRSTHLRSVA